MLDGGCFLDDTSSNVFRADEFGMAPSRSVAVVDQVVTYPKTQESVSKNQSSQKVRNNKEERRISVDNSLASLKEEDSSQEINYHSSKESRRVRRVMNKEGKLESEETRELIGNLLETSHHWKSQNVNVNTESFPLANGKKNRARNPAPRRSKSRDISDSESVPSEMAGKKNREGSHLRRTKSRDSMPVSSDNDLVPDQGVRSEFKYTRGERHSDNISCFSLPAPPSGIDSVSNNATCKKTREGRQRRTKSRDSPPVSSDNDNVPSKLAGDSKDRQEGNHQRRKSNAGLLTAIPLHEYNSQQAKEITLINFPVRAREILEHCDSVQKLEHWVTNLEGALFMAKRALAVQGYDEVATVGRQHTHASDVPIAMIENVPPVTNCAILKRIATLPVSEPENSGVCEATPAKKGFGTFFLNRSLKSASKAKPRARSVEPGVSNAKLPRRRSGSVTRTIMELTATGRHKSIAALVTPENFELEKFIGLPGMNAHSR